MTSDLHLDDEASALLAAEAHRRGIEPEDLAGEAIKAYLGGHRRRLSFVALGHSTSGFRAANAESVLGSEFGMSRS